LACARHIKDLEHGPDRGLIWKPELVERIYQFFLRYIRIPVGGAEPQPFILQPWQCFIQGSIFGWLRSDGCRRFRTAYIEVGKGNGKSPMAAGTGLYGLRADGEYAAEIYAAATQREQARIIFDHAVSMVANSPELQREILPFASSLVYKKAYSRFRPVSSEKRGLDGIIPHMALVDEIHEHPDGTVVNKMAAGAKGRKQPLTYEITNSGYDRLSVCFNHHELSRKVLEGALENDSWFAYVAQLDEGDDWKHDEACWPKTNPNLDVSVTREYLRKQVQQATQIPAEENIVARLNFCIWTEQATRAIAMDAWRKCATPVFGKDDLAGERCWGGLDLSSTTDLSAFVLHFPPTDERKLAAWLCWLWMPEEKIRYRAQQDHAPYDLWEKQGYIKLTEGNIVDYDAIRADINALGQIYNVREIAADRWNATQLITQLAGDGFTIFPFGQGFASMNAPTKELLKMVTGRQFTHSGNPALDWMASNLATQQDPAGNLKPDKAKSSGRIDGIVAGVMATARAMVNGEERTGGIIVL
jgi:phage terminase large subunit-like protein